MRAGAVISLAFLIAATASADVFHVRPDGLGDFPTIRDAMYACSDGDTVELADGTFTGYGNRDLVFAGTALTVRSASGNPLACIIDCGGSPSYQHRGFKFDPGVGRESVLEGVTIRHGCMVGQPMPPHGDNRGAAIRCESASPTIRNCRFVSNSTLSYFAAGSGGAVHCREESSPLFEDCFFIDNESGLGGGMRCLRSSAVIIGCTFTENTATDEGGGLSCWSCEPVLIDVEFLNNTAETGGGLKTYSASLRLENCVFTGNVATDRGGAVQSVRASVLEFTDCVFVGNSSANSGGAIHSRGYSDALSIVLTDVEFLGNTAGESGGAMEFRESVIDLAGALVVGNSATAGGAVVAYDDCDVTIAKSTVVGNEVTADPLEAGALRVFESSSITAIRSIVAENISCAAVTCGEGGSATLVCCDAFGNAGGDWVGCIAHQCGLNGNFWADPLFCLELDPDHPYSLHDGSPCLPESSPCGELVGAFGEGCGAITPIREATWGAIKARFR
jgi:predicted outer membrane repeat protein